MNVYFLLIFFSSMRILSWNVNGLAATAKEISTRYGGLKEYFCHELNADVVCFQETKLQKEKVEKELACVDGFESFWSFSKIKKGYSGVSTYVKLEYSPLEVQSDCFNIKFQNENDDDSDNNNDKNDENDNDKNDCVLVNEDKYLRKRKNTDKNIDNCREIFFKKKRNNQTSEGKQAVDECKLREDEHRINNIKNVACVRVEDGKNRHGCIKGEENSKSDKTKISTQVHSAKVYSIAAGNNDDDNDDDDNNNNNNIASSNAISTVSAYGDDDNNTTSAAADTDASSDTIAADTVAAVNGDDDDNNTASGAAVADVAAADDDDDDSNDNNAVATAAVDEEEEQGNELNNEGRLLVSNHETFYLLNVYVPNGGDREKGRPRLKVKLKFLYALDRLCDEIVQAGKNFLLVGDLNIAHKKKDIFREWNIFDIYNQEELKWMDSMLTKHVDIFRHFHPRRYDCFTVWNMKTNARERNEGLRIDYAICNQGFINEIHFVDIMKTPKSWSDHAAIAITLKQQPFRFLSLPRPPLPLSSRSNTKFQADKAQQKLTSLFQNMHKRSKSICEKSNLASSFSMDMGEERSGEELNCIGKKGIESLKQGTFSKVERNKSKLMERKREGMNVSLNRNKVWGKNSCRVNKEKEKEKEKKGNKRMNLKFYFS